jgi:hypothetical protein
MAEKELKREDLMKRYKEEKGNFHTMVEEGWDGSEADFFAYLAKDNVKIEDIILPVYIAQARTIALKWINTQGSEKYDELMELFNSKRLESGISIYQYQYQSRNEGEDAKAEGGGDEDEEKITQEYKEKKKDQDRKRVHKDQKKEGGEKKKKKKKKDKIMAETIIDIEQLADLEVKVESERMEKFALNEDIIQVIKHFNNNL